VSDPSTFLSTCCHTDSRGEKSSKGLACQEPHTYRVKRKIGFAQPRLRGGAFFCLFGFAHAAICSLCLDNAGRGLGQHPSGLQCWWSRIAGLPCDARAEVVSGNSLRGLCPLRSNSPGKHDDDACFARPPRHCASQHQQGARPDADPALFPPCWWRATAPQRRHAYSGVTRADAVPGGAPCWRRRRAGRVGFAPCCKQGDGEHV
jgi:hypothetical protein